MPPRLKKTMIESYKEANNLMLNVKRICEENEIPIKDTNRLYKSVFPFKVSFHGSRDIVSIMKYVEGNLSLHETERTARYFVVYCSSETEILSLIENHGSAIAKVTFSKEQTKSFWFTDEGWYYGRGETPVIGPCETYDGIVERVARFNPKPPTFKDVPAKILPFVRETSNA